MIKKLLALTILAVGLSVNACWFTAVNYDKCYIAKINTAVVYDYTPLVIAYSSAHNGRFGGTYLRITDTLYAKDGINGQEFLELQDMGGGYGMYWFFTDEDHIPMFFSEGNRIAPPSIGTYLSTSHWPGQDYFEVVSIPLPITHPPAGTQDLPCQVWVKITPRTAETGYDAPAPISTAMLQYKKLPSGTWTTFKTLTTINWTMDFNKPVQLFGPNIFDPPSAVANDQYLVRLYFTDGIYENADLGTNAPEGGNTVWRNQWVTKITISGKRRPQ